ncbi:Uncharacterised protein [Escherichia coli]|nr:Uncharacterised protein [Escherichia coli]
MPILKLKTEAKIIANFGVETNIHENTTVFFTFDTFLTGRITQYGFTVGKQVKLVAKAGAAVTFQSLPEKDLPTSTPYAQSAD